MAKHTDGPWENNCFLVISKAVPGGMYGGKEICHTGGHGNPSEEAEANARLIAAAPEMLTALISAADMLRTAIETNVTIEGFDPETHNGLKAIRAVIAKATGEKTN